MNLEEALQALSEDAPSIDPEALAERAEGRVRTARRRRGLVAVVAVVALASAVLATGLGWARWRDRPTADPFGEPAATMQWTRPAKPSKEVIAERCGEEFTKTSLPLDWGRTIEYSGRVCSMGWERPDSAAGLRDLPTEPAAFRGACEQQSGKNLDGWQLVALGDEVDFTLDGRHEKRLRGLFRSANGFMGTCWLSTRDGAWLAIVPLTDLGNVLHTPEALLLDSDQLWAGLNAVVGVEGRDDQPDRRATRLVLDAGHGFSPCEIPVTNGYAAGDCLLQPPSDFTRRAAMERMPYQVTVYGRGDRVLRTVTIDG